MPTKPLTPAELAAIKARWPLDTMAVGNSVSIALEMMNLAMNDIAALLDEVGRLRGAIAAFRKWDDATEATNGKPTVRGTPEDAAATRAWFEYEKAYELLRGIAGEGGAAS